jgi:hypothetical protein
LSIGKVLDRSFKIIRDNLALLYGIIILIYIPYFFIQLAFRWFQMQSQQMTAGPYVQPFQLLAPLAAGFVILLLWIFIIPLGTMAVTSAIHSIYRGEKATVLGAYRDVIMLFFPALALMLIVGTLATLGFFFCIIPGIIVYLIFFVVFPVCVIEKRGIIETLQRSYELTKGQYTNIFAIIFLVGIVGYAVSAAFSFGGDAIFRSSSILSVTLYSLANFTGTILVAPVNLVVASMVYFALREEKEGFDLELRAKTVLENVQW